MKVFLLALFVAVAAAAGSPIPDDGNIDVIVNGVPEGEALDIAHIIDIHTHEKVNGEVVASSNVLEPFTSEAIAAAAAAAAVNEVESVPVVVVDPEVPAIPAPIVLPEATNPETILEIPEPIALPEPATPEAVPEAIVLPEPVAPEVQPEDSPIQVVDEPVDGPAPVQVVDGPASPVEVVVEPASPVQEVDEATNPAQVVEPAQVEEIVAAEPAQTGHVYNDGIVSVEVNQNGGVLDTIQSWISMMISYVTDNNVAHTSQVI